MDYSNLKSDGTEDDDDDQDDEVAQNKLVILVAKDVKTGIYAATCLRENGVSEYATSWMVSLLRRRGYRRARLQSDGEPSIVALTTAILLAAPFVELVLRERPAGERHEGREEADTNVEIWRTRSSNTTLTVLVVGGSAPIEGGSSSSTDVPVDSSMAVSMSVEDMVQTNVPVPSYAEIQLSSSNAVGSLCFNESKARDSAFPGKPSRESVQGLKRTCLEMCARQLSSTTMPCSLP